MIGLALEGGADRCAFTAGVVDVLMRHSSMLPQHPELLPVPDAF